MRLSGPSSLSFVAKKDERFGDQPCEFIKAADDRLINRAVGRSSRSCREKSQMLRLEMRSSSGRANQPEQVVAVDGTATVPEIREVRRRIPRVSRPLGGGLIAGELGEPVHEG